MIVKKKKTKIIAVFITGVLIIFTVLTFVKIDKIAKNPLPVGNLSQTTREPQGLEQNSQKVPGSTNSATSENLNTAPSLPSGVNTVTLKSVEGKPGLGTAVMIFDGKNLVIVVEVQLPEMPTEQNYFGWLAKDKSLKEAISLGKLQKSGEKFILSYKQTGNFSKYRTIVITKEANDDDKPETEILSGSF